MGGASRNERKRRQEAANARLAAAGIRVPPKRSNRTALVVVTAVVAVAVIVGVAVLLTRGTKAAVAPTYSASLSGAVVTAGTGPAVVDLYEDYLCPNCERFEARYGDELTTALNAGRITVRYHGVAILDRSTRPPGYSTRAANAALCAVSAGVFPTYHEKLFAAQPAESSAGLTDDQLAAFGTELGAKGDFAGCVRGATHTAAISAETAKAEVDPALQSNGNFGTPTVATNGRKIDLNDPNWLKNTIAAG